MLVPGQADTFEQGSNLFGFQGFAALPRSEGNIFGYRAGEQIGHLHHHADASAQFARRDIFVVLSVKQHGTTRRLVQAIEQA
jgi:hypothetical protein